MHLEGGLGESMEVRVLWARGVFGSHIHASFCGRLFPPMEFDHFKPDAVLEDG